MGQQETSAPPETAEQCLTLSVVTARDATGYFNPLEYRSRLITVRHRIIIWSWHSGRWLVSYYISYSQEGTGRGCSPPRPFLAVPNGKCYYQSGPDWCKSLLPVGAMEALQPFGGQCPRLPLKNETGTNPYYWTLTDPWSGAPNPNRSTSGE